MTVSIAQGLTKLWSNHKKMKCVEHELQGKWIGVGFIPFFVYPLNKSLTLKHRETHGCVASTVATDALVLKHQAISILSTD